MTNWIPVYVIVALIPVVFLCIAIGSVILARRNRQTPEDIDIEMQPYRRLWFPWINAATQSERETRPTRAATTTPARTSSNNDPIQGKGKGKNTGPFGRQSLERPKEKIAVRPWSPSK